MDDAVDGGAGDAVSAGKLAEALPMLTIRQDRSTVQFQRLASDMPSFEASAAHAGAHPFDDQAAFQLGNCSDDDHDGSAERSAGVDLFAERDELDVEVAELIKGLEEMTGGTGDAVEGPNHEHIEAAMAGLFHHLIGPKVTSNDLLVGETKRGFDVLKELSKGGSVRLGVPKPLRGGDGEYYSIEVFGPASSWELWPQRDNLDNLPGTRDHGAATKALAKTLAFRLQTVDAYLYIAATGLP